MVRAEFGGELPAALAAEHPNVVRGDVAVGVVTVPQGDPEFKSLPRAFYDQGNGVRIGINVQCHRAGTDVASQATRRGLLQVLRSLVIRQGLAGPLSPGRFWTSLNTWGPACQLTPDGD
ncbi:hypothetical protein WJX73_005842 [Symbiochloris irregularis]|uniref:Uncharacterized protein n=1 Tax=Symbiochloris irregularis TaxID=706552 RepID=A0AAW1NY20_9CHLO